MANLHIIIGDDDFLVSEIAKKHIGDGVGLEVIDSVSSGNEDLQLADLREADASFSTPPFLDPRKVTWWKNVGFLPQSGSKGPGEAVKAALEKFAARLAASPLPENQAFILSGPRLLMTSIFAKTLKPVAEIVTLSGGKPWDLERQAVSRAIEYAKEAGFAFAPGAAEDFIARVGTDTRSICSEIAKLRDYLGEGGKAASLADVAEITSQGVGVEPAVWSITDAIGARKVGDVISAVRPFERENGFAILVLSVVEKFLRQLVELKSASECGMLEQAGAGMSPYAMKKNVAFLRNWTLRELRAARFRFMKLRERAVTCSGGIDQLVIMELVRTCGIGVRKGR